MALLPAPAESSPRIFRLTKDGQERIEGEVNEHFSLHGPLEWTVAVSDTKRTFLIKGARDSKKELQAMLREYGIQLSTLDSARKCFQFYLDVNPKSIESFRITSLTELRTEADRQFRRVLGDTEGGTAFVSWRLVDGGWWIES